uniref:Uncharacterized protein n=1 Tax=Lactuca sativa TaxID=4236 RepID=A0A9R1XIW0_LACSA|nr:hypothetical protein LSAT_V11C300141370 [Lactuca sativa]
MKEPFLNLTNTPPLPFNPPTLSMKTSPLTKSIRISSIPPLPTMSSAETSQPQTSIPLSTPIFIDSTIPTTSSIITPPEVPIIKYVSHEIRTSGILGNTSGVALNANIVVSSEPYSSSIPPLN